MRRSAAATILVALAGTGPLPAVATPAAGIERDPPCGDPDLAAADCLSLGWRRDGEGLHLEATMGAPLDRGMFTHLEIHVDADGNPDTGVLGVDLQFRAVVGSRFRPTAAGSPAPGVPAPISLARTSWSETSDVEVLGQRPRRTFLHRNRSAPPEVEGAVLRCTLPDSLIRMANRGYAGPLAFRAEVETSIAEQPLFLEHRPADEGLPIVVDGSGADWSGGPSVEDPGGELFEPLRFLDLVGLRVDHDDRNLFVLLDTERPGFAERARPAGDLHLDQSVSILVEPLDGDYGRPRRIEIPRGRPRGTGEDFRYAVRDRTVEVSLARSGLEGPVRVLAWSESVHRDRVPDRGLVKAGAVR
jgi:hypothetical protein